jgi:hypothetical protein
MRGCGSRPFALRAGPPSHARAGSGLVTAGIALATGPFAPKSSGTAVRSTVTRYPAFGTRESALVIVIRSRVCVILARVFVIHQRVFAIHSLVFVGRALLFVVRALVLVVRALAGVVRALVSVVSVVVSVVSAADAVQYPSNPDVPESRGERVASLSAALCVGRAVVASRRDQSAETRAVREAGVVQECPDPDAHASRAASDPQRTARDSRRDSIEFSRTPCSPHRS